MANSLKQMNLVLLFLTVGVSAHCQIFEHRISLPLVSYQITNIPQFDEQLNKKYINNFYLPNFRYEIVYKKKLLVGLENYYFDDHTGSSRSLEGEIRNLRINSFSLLTGYSLWDSNKLKLNIGSGLTYNHSWMGLYLDYYPHEWEGRVCYQYNKFGANFWSSLAYGLSDNFFLRLNLRYNPMFKPFDKNEGDLPKCLYPHNHDRLNYGVIQLAVEYKI